MNRYIEKARCCWKGHDLDLLKFYPGNPIDWRAKYYCNRCKGYYYHKDETLSAAITKCPTCGKDSPTEIWHSNVSRLENGSYNYYPEEKSLRIKCCGTKILAVMVNIANSANK